jgi:hypothetical protein
MGKYKYYVALAVIVMGAMLSLNALAAGKGQDLAIIGTWRINLDKSNPAIRKVRTGSFTWIYSIEGDSIRHTVYEDYPPKYSGLPTNVAPHDHTYLFKIDGKDYPNPEGPNGLGETIKLWRINRNVIYREVYTHGKPTERVVWAVSEDGKTMVNTRWVPDNPTGVASMVFDRVDDSTKP